MATTAKTWRNVLLAACLIAPAGASNALAAGRNNAAAQAEAPKPFEPAAIFAAMSPPQADPERTYTEPDDALLAGDLDYLMREANRALARGDEEGRWRTLAFINAFADGKYADARRILSAAQGGADGPMGDILEPFLLAAEGHVDEAVERVERGSDQFPAPLPDIEKGLLFESAGRLDEASAIYAQMEARLDLTPPGENEPTNMEELSRSLNAGRTTHALYRSALVQHRLGNKSEARRLYELVQLFAPHSADVEANLARLEAGEAPLEPAMNPVRAAGRWLIFLSEFQTQSDALRRIFSGADPTPGLESSSGMMFLQLGLALEPAADDWRLYAANALRGAGGLDGAERVIERTPNTSVFAPDADIVRAQIDIDRNHDDDAAAAVARAVQQGGSRWGVLASAADLYRQIGKNSEAIEALNRALAMVSEAKDRAQILGLRAYANKFAGNQNAATADARAAMEAHLSDNTRLLFVSILMDDPRAWRESVALARQMLAEQPDSSSRLNALGYALIQHPEGLEEGYRLLWRGFTYGQTDAAVIDSLGWAYYQYGSFDEARTLIERANALFANDPNAEVLDHMGDVYWRLNRRDDARQAWTDALAARPEAPRRAALEGKIAHGLTTPAPRQRPLPNVQLPTQRSQRGDT